MAKKLRLDNASISGGVISLGITSALGALPPTASNQNIVFQSRADMVDAVRAFENSLSDEQLVLLLIATGYKVDNALTNATVLALVGKTVQLSLIAGHDLVKVT